MLVDSGDGATQAEVRTARGSLLTGVQTNGRYVAYKDDAGGMEDLLIYDLHQQQQIGHIIPTPGAYTGFYRWADDGGPRLFYIESVRASSPVLKEFDVGSGESRELRRWYDASTVFMCGVTGTKLFSKAKLWGHDGMRLFLWDIATQTEREIKGVRTNGHISVIDHGNRIIYEYWP